MRHLALRVLVFVIGLFVLGLGVAVAINANLGISPATSLPYVISLILGVNPGIVVTITMSVLVLVQIPLLRKRFKLVYLAQIITASIFGYFVDLGVLILRDIRIPTYFGQLFMLAFSVVLFALGIILFIESKLAPMPVEGLILVILQLRPKWKFHILKIITDCTLVAIGIILSLVFLGQLSGIREGTVLSAIFIGKFIPPIKKCIIPMMFKIGLYENPVDMPRPD